MAFIEVKLENLAADLGVSLDELREKQRIMEKIKKLRVTQGLSQLELANIVGVSQSRIAQIESGVGTKMVSFDVLFHILHELGYGIHVSFKKAMAA